MQEYSLGDLKRLFGLPPALVRRLSEVGFITPPAPEGKKGGKSSYTFQDLTVLRVAGKGETMRWRPLCGTRQIL